MTQTQDQTELLIPARRRELPAVPVLIRVPMVAGIARGVNARSRPRRRRLRREVRFAALALLTAFPASLGFFLVGGNRPAPLAIAATSLEADGEDFAMPPLPIRLEPIVTLSAPCRDIDVPVLLPGHLLPADATEETSDGGH